MWICCRACSPSTTAAAGQLATLLTRSPPRAWGRPSRGAGWTAGAWRRKANAVADVITWSMQTDSPHGARPQRFLQPAPARRVVAAERDGCYILYSCVTSHLQAVTQHVIQQCYITPSGSYLACNIAVLYHNFQLLYHNFQLLYSSLSAISHLAAII